jgi:putative PIN family toxin of toxin-antitoxin system
MIVVLDTNVLVSAFISPGGTPDRILRAWPTGAFQLVTSAPLLAELSAVLARPRIRKRTGFSADKEAALVEAFAASCIVVVPGERVNVAPDAADNRLLEAATDADADYLVTGDNALRRLETFRNTQLVTPARFLAILSESSGA